MHRNTTELARDRYRRLIAIGSKSGNMKSAVTAYREAIEAGIADASIHSAMFNAATYNNDTGYMIIAAGNSCSIQLAVEIYTKALNIGKTDSTIHYAMLAAAKKNRSQQWIERANSNIQHMMVQNKNTADEKAEKETDELPHYLSTLLPMLDANQDDKPEPTLAAASQPNQQPPDLFSNWRTTLIAAQNTEVKSARDAKVLRPVPMKHTRPAPMKHTPSNQISFSLFSKMPWDTDAAQRSADVKGDDCKHTETSLPKLKGLNGNILG